MRKTIRVAGAVVGLSLTLTACGLGGDKPKPPPKCETSAPAGTSYVGTVNFQPGAKGVNGTVASPPHPRTSSGTSPTPRAEV